MEHLPYWIFVASYGEGCFRTRQMGINVHILKYQKCNLSSIAGLSLVSMNHRMFRLCNERKKKYMVLGFWYNL